MNFKQKVKRKVLGVGYPWFLYDKVQLANWCSVEPQQEGYYKLLLADKPNRTPGRKAVEIKFGELGAFKKIRLVAEYE